MKLILFTKKWKDRSVADLAGMAHAWNLDGFDLCVRPGYPVQPDNAAEALPEAARRLRAEGLDIPMVTGNFDLLEPGHPTAEPLLAAMDRADIRLLKLGYFKIDPAAVDYPAEVGRVREVFQRWEPLARRHGVRICYHTHSNRCMGLNASALAALLDGFDPACLGAYLDPGHLAVEGEEIDVALAMVRAYLAIVAVKDVLIDRVETNGHGSVQLAWVPSGEGMVDWTRVFDRLRALPFTGPVSVHCEFKADDDTFQEQARKEVAFFRRFV